MSAHRVITDIVGIEACREGTILLDDSTDTLEKFEGEWFCGVNAYDSSNVVLPARILIESWER